MPLSLPQVSVAFQILRCLISEADGAPVEMPMADMRKVINVEPVVFESTLLHLIRTDLVRASDWSNATLSPSGRVAYYALKRMMSGSGLEFLSQLPSFVPDTVLAELGRLLFRQREQAALVRRAVTFMVYGGHRVVLVAEEGETASAVLARACGNTTQLIVTKPEGFTPGSWCGLLRQARHLPDLDRPLREKPKNPRLDHVPEPTTPLPNTAYDAIANAVAEMLEG